MSMYRRESVNSGSFQLTKEGIRATRQFYSSWANVWNALPNSGESHPLFPDARCVSVSVEPVREVGPTISLDSELSIDCGPATVEITAEYTTDFIEIGDLPVIAYRAVGEALELGVGRTWTSDGTVCSMPQAIFVWATEATYRCVVSEETWMTYKDAIYGAQNKVNNADWQGIPAGCCLCGTPQAESQYRYVSGSIIRVWDVTQSFIYKTTEFNTVWRSDKAIWDTFTTPVYDAADFSELGLGN